MCHDSVGYQRLLPYATTCKSSFNTNEFYSVLKFATPLRYEAHISCSVCARARAYVLCTTNLMNATVDDAIDHCSTFFVATNAVETPMKKEQEKKKQNKQLPSERLFYTPLSVQ